MKPSRIQYFFAKDGPTKVYFWIAIVLGLWVALKLWQPGKDMLDDWVAMVCFAATLVLVPALAFYFSITVYAIFLLPFYLIRGRLNGAPYQVGDYVQILVGIYRDRVGEIYEVRNERAAVFVRGHLDDGSAFDKVFSNTQVCRVSRSQPDHKDAVANQC